MKIDILTRKDKPDEVAMIEEIKSVVQQAAQMAHKEIEINVTSNFHEFTAFWHIKNT